MAIDHARLPATCIDHYGQALQNAISISACYMRPLANPRTRQNEHWPTGCQLVIMTVCRYEPHDVALAVDAVTTWPFVLGEVF